MEIRFTQSARKHRISKSKAMHVITHAEPVRSDSSDGERLVWIGKDDSGLELEVIGILIPDGITLIIHVMPNEYRRRYRQ